MDDVLLGVQHWLAKVSKLAKLLTPHIGSVIGVCATLLLALVGWPAWQHSRELSERQAMQSEPILRPFWRVVRRTDTQIDVHAWGVRFRSPECVYVGIEATLYDQDTGAASMATVSRPGGVGPRGTLPNGPYDAGVWSVSLPSGAVDVRVVATTRYECRRGDLVEHVRALLFNIPPEEHNNAND